jgi:uncharacterized protein (TIGR00369 family)
MAWVAERTGPRGTRFTGLYRDPDGHKRSAGTFTSRREALRSANREEQQVLSGAWHDSSQGEVSFYEYVEKEWLPHKHVEVTTRAAYTSYLNKQFYPAFGKKKLNKISPSVIQDWVTKASTEGLSPRSIKKYHAFLSSIFRRAVRDRILVYNPCDHTELPKVITKKSRTLTPDEFDALSGRELMLGYLAGTLPPAPIHNLVGGQVTAVDDTSLTWEWPNTEWLCSPGPTVYGGAIAAHADGALVGAYTLAMEAGQVAAPLDVKVQFLRPVLPGAGDLTGRSEIVHRGRTLIVARSEVFDAAGGRVAVATGSALVVHGGVRRLLEDDPDALVRDAETITGRGTD